MTVRYCNRMQVYAHESISDMYVCVMWDRKTSLRQLYNQKYIRTTQVRNSTHYAVGHVPWVQIHSHVCVCVLN